MVNPLAVVLPTRTHQHLISFGCGEGPDAATTLEERVTHLHGDANADEDLQRDLIPPPPTHPRQTAFTHRRHRRFDKIRTESRLVDDNITHVRLGVIFQFTLSYGQDVDGFGRQRGG